MQLKQSLPLVFPRSPRIAAAACVFALAWAGCGDGKQDRAENAPAEAPRRNASESLGFASEADYFSAPAKPAPAPAATDGSNPGAPAKTKAGGQPSSAATAAIPRTLTGADGRTVEAVLLSRTPDAVKIRRAADSAEFVIPLERLSKEDQAFIRKSALPEN